jgi:hypothetical protein
MTLLNASPVNDPGPSDQPLDPEAQTGPLPMARPGTARGDPSSATAPLPWPTSSARSPSMPPWALSPSGAIPTGRFWAVLWVWAWVGAWPSWVRATEGPVPTLASTWGGGQPDGLAQALPGRWGPGPGPDPPPSRWQQLLLWERSRRQQPGVGAGTGRRPANGNRGFRPTGPQPWQSTQH